MAELHNTVMGKRLIEHTLPEIAVQLKRIADALENKQPAQIELAFKTFVNHYPNDTELGKEIRKLWQK